MNKPLNVSAKIKYLFISAFIAASISCIEEFNPEINSYSDLLVVDASLIKGDNVQTVVLRRSNSLNSDEWPMVPDCEVWISDDANNTFYFTETAPGEYKALIWDRLLTYENSYALHIETKDGKSYESLPVRILPGAPVDSIYYVFESNQTSSSQYEEGLQFYVDLKASDEEAINYRWEVEETYEYRSFSQIWGMYYPYIDSVVFYSEPKDSLYYCWKTDKIPGLFSSSLSNLSALQKKKIALNYVPAGSHKLNYGYALQVKQYALNDEAYEYWDMLKNQVSESGGLYQSQPRQSISNITNINNQEEAVLGYFWASSVTEKRLFYKNTEYQIVYDYSCAPDTFMVAGVRNPNLIFFEPIPWFFYLDLIYVSGSYQVWGISNEYCFDCRYDGGETEKPDYWEEYFE